MPGIVDPAGDSLQPPGPNLPSVEGHELESDEDETEYRSRIYSRHSVHTTSRSYNGLRNSHPTSFEPRTEPNTLHGQLPKSSYPPLGPPAPNMLNHVATTKPPSPKFVSYPSLKRNVKYTDEQSGEAGGDYYRDEMSEPQPVITSVDQAHRLLSFSRLPGRFTLSDQDGRVQQIELSAQLHGMFFLSERVAPS
jgi:hypothetical protein